VRGGERRKKRDKSQEPNELIGVRGCVVCGVGLIAGLVGCAPHAAVPQNRSAFCLVEPGMLSYSHNCGGKGFALSPWCFGSRLSKLCMLLTR
jgi:hypothetical protein